ncbi:MAG: flippase [Anaerolineae bacterium]|jgi:O-antigen/teichoic acid export membrane protein
MTDILSETRVSTPSSTTAFDQNVLTAAKGGGIVFAGSLFQLGNRLVTGVLLARLLGAEQFGLYNLALTGAGVAVGLASLGLGSALVRYVSLHTSRRDAAGLWGTLQVGVGLTVLMSLLIGSGLYALATPVAEQLFHEPKLVPLLRLASLIVPFWALTNALAAATRGFKKMQYTVAAQDISQPTIKLVVLVGLAIVAGLTAAEALTAYGLAQVAACVLLLYFLNNKLFSLKRPLRTAQRNTRDMLSFSLPVYLSSLVSMFGGNVETVLLGALNTVTSVGIFAVASQVNMVGKMFHGSVVTASMPIVSELHDRGEREQMGRFYQTMSKWTFTLNLPMFLVVLLFPVPILSIFGQSFISGATALAILAWANLVNTGTGICGVMIDMTGNTSLKLVNSVVTFALTLGLNILLIPTWGLTGAAVAGLASSIMINLLRLLEVFILFRLLPYNLSFVKPVAAGLVAMAIAWSIHLLFPPGVNLIYTAMNASILLAAYGGIILLLGLSQEDRTVLARVSRRVAAVLPR